MSLVGTTVGAFAIEAELGESRWGMVYRAAQQSVQRTVALKTVSPAMAEVPGQAEHFREVMRATAQLAHAHIATIYEAGHADGVHYCAMEYMDGPPLAEFVRRDNAVDEHHLLQVIAAAARALQFLWQRNVPHLPPAPRHILTTSTGLIKLINVLPLDAPPSSSPQEDILALGLILAHLANEISLVSKPVSEIVERMVGAADREPFGSLAELAEAAADLDHELFPPSAPSQPALRKNRSRTIKPVILVAGILAVALVVAGLVAWRMHRAEPPAVSSPATP